MDGPVETLPAPQDLTSGGACDPDEVEGSLAPITEGLVGDDGRVRLSYSRVETYRTCPAQFRYTYIEQLPGEPSPHLAFGSSLHAALERFYDRKLPQCPSEEELLAYLYDVWDTSGFAGMSRDEQLAWYRHGQAVLRRFHRRQAPSFRLPADVEKWFEVPFGDNAVVVGSIDRVDVHDDGSLEVVDYKTNRRVRDRDGVRRSLQLAIYAIACEHLYGRLPSHVTLDFVVAGLRVRVPVAEIDLDAARRAVDDAARAVLDGRYTPAPSRLCDWCDFRAVCPAWQGEGPDVLGAAVTALERLRRQVHRDVRTLRQLEAGVGRLTAELAARVGEHSTSPPQ
ncbi:MAG TPA: PD-(D/E)XK nuclease family protein [Nitriliruptorales bacterium]|nr:PD-(D/E)XK nuclease family protein [Nitriliruptorales bacterium]